MLSDFAKRKQMKRTFILQTLRKKIKQKKRFKEMDKKEKYNTHTPKREKKGMTAVYKNMKSPVPVHPKQMYLPALHHKT